MSSVLPIDIADLLNGRVESVRLEFKAAWDEHTTGPQALRTICAFANDFQNLNGGYLVIGVAESNGRPQVAGLNEKQLDEAQRWIRGNCRGMRPGYAPILSPETLEDQRILVVWAPASQDRPHCALEGPKKDPHGRKKDPPWRYWIRIGPETVDAEANGKLQSLLEQTARIPWDNQISHDASVDDLREGKVREHLHDVRSALRYEQDAATIYRDMNITAVANGHDAPRNVGLLFFSDNPEQWFPGARIVVAQFAADRAGDVQNERVFRGGLAAQVRDCLHHLEGLSLMHLKKERDRSQVRGWVSYPVPALREALVNAVFHRGYRPDLLEPTKVCLYPDRVEVISYPGPVAGIEPKHFEKGAPFPPVGSRNPRVGEFLKQLRLAEGWRTGLPRIYQAMEENGSPAPHFDFDATWFRATLPAHPEYAAVSALQDAAYLRTVGSNEDAFRRIRDAWRMNESSAVLASELIGLLAADEKMDEAEQVFSRFRETAPKTATTNVTNTWIEVLLNHGRSEDARCFLKEITGHAAAQDAIDTAILARRLDESQMAHGYFERAGDAIQGDARAQHEFAQTKMRLAQKARDNRQRSWQAVNRRLLLEARNLLERVVQMDASATRHAWAWRDLARVLNWLRQPTDEVESAFAKAMALLPSETRFGRELAQFREQRSSSNSRRKPSDRS